MKAIIDGKLYDTEAANLIAIGNYTEVYRTRKGNWFKQTYGEFGCGCRIVPINEQETMSLVGRFAPDNYEEYFGEPEEA